MVSLGNNLIGSQFFFTLGDDLTSLDGVHCVIGQAVEGLDVLRKLNEAICDNTHRPYQDIRITHTVILEDPFDNPRGFREPSRSPSPTPARLRGGRIAADEDIDDTTGKSEIEVQEMLQEREAKARATILEIVGDLPDADIAPPENVLFVCKLNSVTTDDDLEIIFSRFGKIKGCEVIRDRKSGDSLQYAFVEFEEQKSCEAAYLKMDNVLIDDRRIHVDFSQSVSKVQWRGKGRGLIIKDGSKDQRLNFDNYKGGDNRRNGGNQRRDAGAPMRRDQRNGNRNGRSRSRSRSRSDNNGRGGRYERNSPSRNRYRNDRPRNASPQRDRRQRSRSNPSIRGRDDRNRDYRNRNERSREDRSRDDRSRDDRSRDDRSRDDRSRQERYQPQHRDGRNRDEQRRERKRSNSRSSRDRGRDNSRRDDRRQDRHRDDSNGNDRRHPIQPQRKRSVSRSPSPRYQRNADKKTSGESQHIISIY